MPGPVLESCGGSSPLQQRFEQGRQGLACRAAQHRGQEQGLGAPFRAWQAVLAAELANGVDVAIQLALLRQQAFHQWAVLVVLFQSAQQQLAEGPQSGQGVA